MEKKDLLKQLIVSFQQKLPVDLLNRQVSLPIGSNKIITVPGVRRSGKSSILLLTINHLLSRNISKENILFINFDDERLNLKVDEFDLIIQAYRELFPAIPFQKVYVFFDEIQVSDGWEKFVRRIYDQETKNIFISGSNSKMLATDIATSLRGRTLQFEIFPLSFSEFCAFKNLETNVYYSVNRAKLISSFKEYLINGSFPEVVLSNYEDADRILQEYYFMMLYKDMVERFQIQNVIALKFFIQRIIANLTKTTSINKIYHELKSAGIASSKNFLYQIIEFAEAVYLFFKLTRYEKSYLKETFSDRKYYCIDNGLKRALQLKPGDDLGQLLENNIFLWLRRNTFFQVGLHFYKLNKECDFVVFDRDKPAKLIQSCWDISEPDTLKREIAGLIEAAKYLNCDDLTIITVEEEKEIEQDNYTIKVVPAWKEMLNT